VEPTGPDSLDTVIQQLFALGLTVQSVAVSLDDERSARLADVVAGIDATIGAVRAQLTHVPALDR
jgi:hypothetical protein